MAPVFPAEANPSISSFAKYSNPFAMLEFGFALNALVACSCILITSGQSIGDAMKQIKPPIFFKEVNAFKAQIQNWNINKIDRALEILIESDLLTKTKPGLGKSIIGNIVIRLATVAKKQPN